MVNTTVFFILMQKVLKHNIKGVRKTAARVWVGGTRAATIIKKKDFCFFATSRSEGTAEGGCGGNSAVPERKRRESSACSARAERLKQNFLFLLEEKMGRAQNKKCKENFA